MLGHARIVAYPRLIALAGGNPLRLVLVVMSTLLALLPLRQGMPRPPLPANPQTTASAPITPAQRSALNALPLSFEPAPPTADQAVHFQARVLGGTAHFTSRGVGLTLPPEISGLWQPQGEAEASKHELPLHVDIRFLNANPVPRVHGVEQLPGSTSYFLGNKRARWRSNLPTYAGIMYEELYPGVDLHYDGRAGMLKGNFTVAPKADPTTIRWHYDGAQALEIDGSGNLVITLEAPHSRIEHELSAERAQIVESAPVAWQELGGRRVPVEARFILLEPAAGHGQVVGFALGAYDHTLPLIIDPTLRSSTRLGGPGFDQAGAITVDAAGYIYIAGETYSASFPETGEPHPRRLADIFVMKLNPGGNSLIFSAVLGGSAQDEIRFADITGGLAVAQNGDVVVSAQTSSTDFPTKNAMQPAFGGGTPDFGGDAFVARLNASGSELLYSSYIGGSGYENSAGVDLDSNGNAYIAGQTNSPNFRTQNARRTSFSGGFNDTFVIKLDPQGALLYATYFGSDRAEFTNDVAVGPGNTVFLTGRTSSGDLASRGAFQTRHGGNYDAFVLKLDPASDEVRYFTYLGGSIADVAADIAVDAGGSAYVTGLTFSANFPTQNAFQPVLNKGCGAGACFDAFVAKINPDGMTLRYSSFLGGSQTENAYFNGGLGAIAADQAGNAYVVGYTDSPDFPILNAMQATPLGADDIFIIKLKPGGERVYSTYFGGKGTDRAYGVAIAAGDVYLTGMTNSADFPVRNPVPDMLNGSTDAFVVHITEHVPVSGIEVALSAPTAVVTGKNGLATIVITYTNNGAETATSLRLLAVLPEGTTYAGSSSDVEPVVDGNTLTWPLADLPTWESRQFHLRLIIPKDQAGAPHPVSLSLRSGATDVAPENDTATVNLFLGQPTFLPMIRR